MSEQVAQTNPSVRRSAGWFVLTVVAEVVWLIFLVWMAWQA